ncbi:MAG TPA: peptide deformylase [Porticoccus sp.]|nr:peptide deformylase [Porticoccus sp.]
MAQQREIAQLGSKVIRQVALEVKDILSTESQALIEDMLLTVAEAKGVGIAAPQVYQSKRLFIMCSKPNSRYPDAPEMEPTAVINPNIIWASDTMEKGWEGCLSLPGIRGLVPRHDAIRVHYNNRDNDPVEIQYEGFLARVFQHELDHLNGIVFIDRVESTTEIMMEKEWLKMMEVN